MKRPLTPTVHITKSGKMLKAWRAPTPGSEKPVPIKGKKGK